MLKLLLYLVKYVLEMEQFVKGTPFTCLDLVDIKGSSLRSMLPK